MMRRVLLATVCVWAVACSKKLEGPTPTVAAVEPEALCVEQLTTSVTLSGTNFAPLTVDTLLDGPSVVLPDVTFSKEVELDGTAGSGTLEYSGEPTGANASLVTWTSQQQMAVSVEPSLALPTGLYGVTVTTEAGAAGSKAGVLLAVPPPSLASLSQDLACLAQDTTITLSGDFFITDGTRRPGVTVGAASVTPTTSDCRALPGESAWEACKTMSITVAADTQPAGIAAVTVTNPAPMACVSASRNITFVARPRVTSVQPLAVCSQAAMQTLAITGEGFLTVDGVGPTLLVGTQTFTPTPGACAPLAGPAATVQTCTSLTLTVPAGTFAPGSYPVQVRNPAPADCASSEMLTLVVRPPPVITDVQPRNVCAGNATLTATGTGFIPGSTVTLNNVSSTGVTVNAAGTSAAATFSMLEPGGPFTVTLDNGDGCSATAPVTVTVIPGPQLFFVDPPVAYNGITTQATAFGTGLTGAVQSVSLVPTAGGAAIPLTFTHSAMRQNQVQLLVPAGTAPGTYDVLLSDQSSCSARLVGGLQVVDQKTLQLATPAVTPEFGHTSTNTAVTIEAATPGMGATGFLAVPRVYLNPNPAGATSVAAPVGAVAFLSSTRLTGLVPTTTLPVGTYDVIVVNPDGAVGVADAAFRVVADAPPTITSLAPGSVSNSNPQTFTIEGKDFRTATVTLSCVDGTGAALATSPAATVTNATATSLTVSFNASVAGVACVVRVTNGDNQTFGDFSALVITNPAQNLYAATPGPNLAEARRAPVTLGGNATSTARFLHVIGGDPGDGGALGSVESSPLDRLGVPGAFFTQRNALATPRALAAGANVGRYLYVAGGSSDGGILDTVERAAVLDPNERGEVTDLLLEVGTAGLDAGTWYYRVAPVMAATDGFNPGGENLPSDPFPVRLPDLAARKLAVTVSWKADPGAAKYLVYRSTTPGATVGTEQLIAEVNAPTTSFKDTGLAPISTQVPLPVGSTGLWTTLTPRLATPRAGAGVTWARDPGDPAKLYLYVLGGRQSATTTTNAIEFLELTESANGAQAPAASFTTATAVLSASRWQLSAAQATSALNTSIPAGTTYLYALAGLTAGGATTSASEAYPVLAGGQPGTRTLLPTGNMQRAGYGLVIAGNYVFAFGGAQGGPSDVVVSGQMCQSGVSGCGTAQVPQISSWNAGQSMLTARYLLGATLSGAFIYVTGGATATAAASTSTEYRLW